MLIMTILTGKEMAIEMIIKGHDLSGLYSRPGTLLRRECVCVCVSVCVCVCVCV